jgi:hypothetical protein
MISSIGAIMTTDEIRAKYAIGTTWHCSRIFPGDCSAQVIIDLPDGIAIRVDISAPERPISPRYTLIKWADIPIVLDSPIIEGGTHADPT